MNTIEPPNRLFVEGSEEFHVIPQLIEKLGITWGEADQPEKWPATIMQFGGVEGLLRPGVISTALNYRNLQALGVIVDADIDANARWQRIRAQAIRKLPTLPDRLPLSGLIHHYDDDGPKRFGVWVMPDNSSTGMLETFLSQCVPDRNQGLWPFIEKHCDDARTVQSAPYKPVHRDKALIHSWLAVQNPPGQQMHLAIIKNTLVPSSPQAAAFLAWFCNLFDRPIPVS